MQVTLKNFQFENLFKYEKLFNLLTPSPSFLGGLNAILYIDKQRGVFLEVPDHTAWIRVQIPVTVERNGPNLSFGIHIEYQKLFYILRSYTKEELQTMEFFLTADDETQSSTFLITVAQDKLQIPHVLIPDAREEAIEETSEWIDQAKKEKNSHWDLLDDKEDFIAGITQCLQFVGPDEKKNNALAIYSDKLIINDRRHVFIYHLNTPVPFIPRDEIFISLHKKAAKIISFCSSFSTIQSLNFSKDKIWFWTEDAVGLINNSISNIVPPTEEDLLEIKPTIKIISFPSTLLRETCFFFNGFYTAAMDWNPLTLENRAGQLVVLLKDSGSVEYGSCNVERILPGKALGEDFSVTIINDSLKMFLSKIPEEKELHIYVEENKPAVYIDGGKTELYLAKLQ